MAGHRGEISIGARVNLARFSVRGSALELPLPRRQTAGDAFFTF